MSIFGIKSQKRNNNLEQKMSVVQKNIDDIFENLMNKRFDIKN